MGTITKKGIILLPKHSSNEFFRNFHDRDFVREYDQYPSRFMVVWERWGYDARDNFGRAVPHLLVASGMTNVLNYLIDVLDKSDNPILGSRDSMGRSLFHYLALYNPENSVELAKKLVDKGYFTRMEDIWGRSPLHYAAISGAKRFIREFGISKYSLTTLDIFRRPAMFYAAMLSDDVELFSSLFVRIDHVIYDVRGKSVKDWAKQFKHHSIVSFLVRNNYPTELLRPYLDDEDGPRWEDEPL